MNSDNNKKRPMLYYYVMALLIIMLINTVIMPTFFSPKVHDVSYNSFMQMVDEGKLSKVEITDKRIAALGKGEQEKEIYGGPPAGRASDEEQG